jgi:hypothetical protein
MKNINNKYIKSYINDILNLRIYLTCEGLCYHSRQNSTHVKNINDLIKIIEDVSNKLDCLKNTTELVGFNSKCFDCNLKDKCISFGVLERNKIM